MAEKAARISVHGSWIARDSYNGVTRWVVKVPGTPQGVFPFERNGSNRAYQQALAYHSKMEVLRQKDKEFLEKNGYKEKRVRADNNTGVTGVRREVVPVLTGRARVVFHAYYTNWHLGVQKFKSFSNRAYVSIEEAFNKAVEQRKKWERQYGAK